MSVTFPVRTGVEQTQPIASLHRNSRIQSRIMVNVAQGW